MSGVEQTYLFVHDHVRLKTWFPVTFLAKPCELFHELSPYHPHRRERPLALIKESNVDEFFEKAGMKSCLTLYVCCSLEQIHSITWLEHVGT